MNNVVENTLNLAPMPTAAFLHKAQFSCYPHHAGIARPSSQAEPMQVPSLKE